MLLRFSALLGFWAAALLLLLLVRPQRRLESFYSWSRLNYADARSSVSGIDRHQVSHEGRDDDVPDCLSPTQPWKLRVDSQGFSGPWRFM